MESISSILSCKSKTRNSSSKKSLLNEAYIFAQIKLIIQKIVTEQYSQFQNDFEELQTIFKQTTNENIRILKIQLLTSDNSFLTWLKTEQLSFITSLKIELKIKQILNNDDILDLKLGKK